MTLGSSSSPAPVPRAAGATRELRLPRGRLLPLAGSPRVMGILNITPDSFSDGGRWLDADRAVEHGLRMLEEGADLLDLGAESTRPGGGVYGAGAADVAVREELERLLPVLSRLRELTDAPLSVDTRKGAVARAALEAGADLINDITALGDPTLGEAVAAASCPLVLMHSRGEIGDMQKNPHYDDLQGEIRRELGEAVDRALACGIDRDQLVVDPGIGFGKTYAHNYEILGQLEFLDPLKLPVLVGASRKSFIGHAIGGAPPEERLAGSLATVGYAALKGAEIVRVHDVLETVRFLRTWSALSEYAGRNQQMAETR